MKNLTKISCLTLFGLLVIGTQVTASTTGGSLSTGIDTGISGVVITVPVASPVAGTYTSRQDVALTAPGATSIHYTFDGSAPTCTSQTYYTGVPIPVGESLTIKALSCYANNNQSVIKSFTYNIASTPPTPPSGGGGGVVTPPTTYSVGDINNNGKVDIIDFALMMANWGKTEANSSDLNGDNKVDIIDFALLMANWSI